MNTPEFDFRETVVELWGACGDRKSWESGLTDVIAKKLMLIAIDHKKASGWSDSLFEAAMLNYAKRKVLIGLI